MIKITHKEIDFANYYQQINHEQCGAICAFFGNVRQGDFSEKIEYIFYDSYEKAAKKELQNITEQIKTQFPIKKVIIVHRLGKVLPSQTSLLVLVSAPHRKESFAACEKIIEKIKEVVPIWKKEVFKNQSYWKNG
jgi:molybdopterin synthase catalytic subunit